MNKNVWVKLLRLAPKFQDFQVYKPYDVTAFSPKNGRAKYEKSQRDREDRKDKKDGENKKSERDRGGHRGNKVNLVVEESSGFKANVYYHKLY